MYDILRILHSLIRYAFIFSLLYAIYRAFTGWQGNKLYTAADNKASVFLIIFLHTNLVIGLLLYFFVSPYVTSLPFTMKDPTIRFWKVEHIGGMLIAGTLIQVGRIVSKKAATDLLKHKKAAIYYTIGLVIALASIPWPFSATPRPWLPF